MAGAKRSFPIDKAWDQLPFEGLLYRAGPLFPGFYVWSGIWRRHAPGEPAVLLTVGPGDGGSFVLVQSQYDGLGITELPGDGVVELEDDLGMRKGEPALAPAFDRVVEDVVDLDHAIMGKGAVGPGDVLHGITGPADVAGPGAILESAVGRTAALILHGGMVDRVVWAAGELVDIIGNLDRKAVVQVAGQDKDGLVETVPELDEFLTLLQEHGPGVILLDPGLLVRPAPASDVGNHEVDRGDHEDEVGFAFADAIHEPFQLLFAEHGGLGVIRFVHIVEATVTAGIKEEEVAVRDREFSVATATDGIGSLAIRLGRRGDLQLVGAQDLYDLVDRGVGISRFGIKAGIGNPGGGSSPVDV